MSGCDLFATGAFIRPVLCTIDGITEYRFVVTSFEEDTFCDDNEVPVVPSGKNLEDLIGCDQRDENGNCNDCDDEIKGDEIIKCHGCGFLKGWL